MVQAALWLTAIGVGVILLLIPVSIRLLKSVLLADDEREPAVQRTQSLEQPSRREGRHSGT